MPTDADIGNMALSRLGTRATITSLTENSTEARALVTWYATVRDSLLQATDWNFNRIFASLALSGTAPTRWGYSYAYPSDCLRLWGFDVGLPTYITATPSLFEIGSDGTNRMIWTNLSSAVAVYGQRVSDPNRMPPSFVAAFACALAAAVAFPITQKQDIAARLEKTAHDLYEIAAAQSANEQTSGERFIPAESLQVRDTLIDERYIDGAVRSIV